MKLNYNVTGEQRKSLVGTISQELNLPMKYLGAPTFAFQVGKYHIDKAGTVMGPDSLGLEDALHRRGFDAEEHEYDQSGTESDRLVIEMPLAGFTPEKLDNLNKLVNAKAPLLKAALCTEDLPIQQTSGTLVFPWFGGNLDGDTAKAYAQLIEKLCAAAKEKHHVTAKEREVENPKYAMRCWLLSLGFIGTEYKTARKMLLKNLDGNSSYKSGAKEKTEVQDDVSK